MAYAVPLVQRNLDGNGRRTLVRRPFCCTTSRFAKTSRVHGVVSKYLRSPLRMLACGIQFGSSDVQLLFGMSIPVTNAPFKTHFPNL